MKTSASSNSPLAFDRYPEYQNSNVEWLGDVPASWEVKKVKRLCLVRRGASPRPIDDLVYFDDEGEYAWVRIADVTASDRYLEHTTQRLSNLGKSKSVPLEPGELFVSIAATVGKPIITKIKCCIHDGFVYFVGLNENREYLYYVFSCGEPYRGLGKLGTQLNLNTATIGDIFLPVPSRQQQDAIVRFLDRETGKIDALVAKKEEADRAAPGEAHRPHHPRRHQGPRPERLHEGLRHRVAGGDPGALGGTATRVSAARKASEWNLSDDRTRRLCPNLFDIGGESRSGPNP